MTKGKKEKGEKRESLNWFVKIFTLGDRFSARDFYDRLKKGFVEFLIVFFGVLVSFSVEKQGEDFDDRAKNIDNLVNLKEELNKMKLEVEEYIGSYDFVKEIFQKQYDRWELKNDSIFLELYDDGEDSFHFAPMGMYAQRDPFNPERVVYESIKLDGTFRFLGTEIGRKLNLIYDGATLGYIMENTAKVEEKYVDKYLNQLSTKWVYDLNDFDVDDNEFWIQNKAYIQNDKFIKYNLYKRLENWDNILSQFEEFSLEIDQGIEILDNEIELQNSQWTFIWWWMDRPSWLPTSQKLEQEEPQAQELSAVQ